MFDLFSVERRFLAWSLTNLVWNAAAALTHIGDVYRRLRKSWCETQQVLLSTSSVVNVVSDEHGVKCGLCLCAFVCRLASS